MVLQMRSEVLKTVQMWTVVFWAVTMCDLVVIEVCHCKKTRDFAFAEVQNALYS
jgi:hypothetical protein